MFVSLLKNFCDNFLHNYIRPWCSKYAQYNKTPETFIVEQCFCLKLSLLQLDS